MIVRYAKINTYLKALFQCHFIAVQQVNGGEKMSNEYHISKDHLLELIYFARRYCDNRSTYAPHRFNLMYESIMTSFPELREGDTFDKTLMHEGQYWPYAQDWMYDEETGDFDARPLKRYER